MEELLTSPVTLMTARSGVVVYARRRTFGQDRGVAGARQTFRQCCKTNTCKLYQPRVVEAGRNLHRQGDGDQKVLACEAQVDRETELRELRKENKRLENEGRNLSVQGGQASEEVRCEEDEKIEVDGEVDSKKKLDQRKRELVKQMRKIDEFTYVPQNGVD